MTTLVEQCAGLPFDVSIKAVLLAALAGGGLAVFRIRSSNVRHRVWTAVLVAMVLLPLLVQVTPAVPLPAWMVPAWGVAQDNAPIAMSTQTPSMSTVAKPSVEPTVVPAKPQAEVAPSFADDRVASNGLRGRSVDGDVPLWLAVVVSIYAVVAVVFVGRLASAIVRAQTLVRGSRPAKLPPGDAFAVDVTVLESDAVRVPLTVGWRRPVILLPADWPTWSAAMLAAVLRHEQTHVARGDHWITLLAEWNRAVYWFHPVAWLVRRRLAVLAEATCDDAVIASLGDRAGYARHLLEVAGRLADEPRRLRLKPAGVAMARTPQVERRINAILDARRPLARRLGVVGAIALVVVAVPLVLLAAGLKPGAPDVTTVCGQVVDANSRPVAGAELRLIVARQAPTMRVLPGDLWWNGINYWSVVQSPGSPPPSENVLEMLSTTTGPDGRFRFDGVRSGPYLEIAYWGEGVSQGRVENVQRLSDAERRDLTIDAVAPGIVRGTIDRQALPEVSGVQLGGPVRLIGPQDTIRPVSLWLDVASQDSYEFRDVPPGSYGLIVYGEGRHSDERNSTPSLIQRLDVEVRPGETTDVDVTRRGRPVVARLVMPAGLAPGYDWRCAIVEAHAVPEGDVSRPRVPFPENINPRTDRQAAAAWVEAWLATDAGKRFQEELIRYEQVQQSVSSVRYRTSVAADGSLRLADTPPGRYELTVGAPRPGASGLIRPDQLIASLKYTFTVPEMEDGSSGEPLDLGELVLEARQRAER